MSNISELLQSLFKMPELTQKEKDDTVLLLNLYSPLVSQSVDYINECTEVCYDSRRQSVTDFIDLALDYDHDCNCRRIAEQLSKTGHYMDLLKILESALERLHNDPYQKEIYYRIIRTRYFGCCRSNEAAYLQLGISSSTFYRNIHLAQQAYGVMLWHVAIPRFISEAQSRKQACPPSCQNGSQMGVERSCARNVHPL